MPLYSNVISRKPDVQDGQAQHIRMHPSHKAGRHTAYTVCLIVQYAKQRLFLFGIICIRFFLASVDSLQGKQLQFCSSTPHRMHTCTRTKLGVCYPRACQLMQGLPNLLGHDPRAARCCELLDRLFSQYLPLSYLIFDSLARLVLTLRLCSDSHHVSSVRGSF